MVCLRLKNQPGWKGDGGIQGWSLYFAEQAVCGSPAKFFQWMRNGSTTDRGSYIGMIKACDGKADMLLRGKAVQAAGKAVILTDCSSAAF